jgi:Niemann-Pick C1 protein
VNEVDLYITEKYVVGTHESCKNVQFPSSGQLGLDLMCGGLGSLKCTPVEWFKFMGNADEDVVPFQINYKIQNSTEKVNGFTPLNPRVVPCNESVDVSYDKAMMNIALEAETSFYSSQGIQPACSCVDCVSSCPKPPAPEPLPQKFIIWGLDGYAVVMFFIFLLGSTVFLTAVSCCSNAEKVQKSE